MKSYSYICDTGRMPIFDGKRLEFVGVRFNEGERDEFLKISEDQDRPVSYVVRELALRGLVLYLSDKKLKMTPEELEFAKAILSEDKPVAVAAKSKSKVKIENETQTKKTKVA